MTNFWKGIAFPLKGTLASLVEEKDDETILGSSVMMIVMTALGERVMYPTFGSLVSKLVFEPNNEATVEKAKRSIRDALKNWDDRVELVGVDFEIRENQLWCKLKWKRAKQGTFNIQEIAFALSPDYLSS